MQPRFARPTYPVVDFGKGAASREGRTIRSDPRRAEPESLSSASVRSMESSSAGSRLPPLAGVDRERITSARP
eukprot:scaffold4777_cov258-Pinguiococcus_pyrenoidosus.AAC.2